MANFYVYEIICFYSRISKGTFQQYYPCSRNYAVVLIIIVIRVMLDDGDDCVMIVILI